MFLIYICGIFDTGSPLLVQERVGKFQRTFKLIKFRTMKTSASNVATHLADVSAITKLGKLLRRTKLDELPQFWNVLIGDMSLVGPRPCLPNQVEVIQERAKLGVYNYRPGITGLSQINRIDMSTPSLLARTDLQMLEDLKLTQYFKYVFLTFIGKGSGDRTRSNS